MYNLKFITSCPVFVVLLLLFVYNICHAHVNNRRFDLSCSDFDFYSCINLLESKSDLSIDIQTDVQLNTNVFVNIQNATLYEALNLIFKQANIRNYYSKIDIDNNVCEIKIFNLAKKYNVEKLVIKNDNGTKNSLLNMNEIRHADGIDNSTINTLSPEAIEILNRETTLIQENDRVSDIFVQQEYLKHLQSETDELMQQEKQSEANILPEHLELLQNFEPTVTIETELSGEDLEVLRSLN